MSEKIKAGLAALKVIESWGVKQIYGLPAGSLNAEMDMLYEEQSNIDFIQVRHEEVGALAASMQPKFSGNIGVVLGSGGPDRKSTRLNSSHVSISYAVFCL